MWLSSILNSLSPSSPHTRTRRRPSPRQRPVGRRLTLETLEDRMLLSFTFTPIADTSPGSPYSGLPVGQAINDRGQVALVAVLKSGGQAIYRTEADGQLTTIAHSDGLIRDFYLSPYLNDSGTVSFGADLTDGRQALFTGSGGDLTRIADTEPASPFSSLPAPAPRIGSDGTVYFQAPLRSGGKGFFAGDGGPPSTLYVTGGEFSAFPGSPASQVHGDTLAFRATLTGGPAGVFRGNGLHTDTIVTAGDTYSSFLGSEINDAGTVGIIANLTAGGQAIVIAKDGTLTTFVDTSGPFSRFAEGRLSISNQEGAVFGADLAAGGTGIFDGPDPAVDKILAKGDELFGSTVVGFPTNFLNPRGLNNVGQIVFRVNLADGRTVLVRADPPLATVASEVINDGAAQRSMVNSLTVTFDSVVTIDPGAFELRREGGGLVDLQFTTSVVAGKTVAVLTFVGSDIIGGSLADGSYSLTVRADRVHDRFGRELDGDGDGLPGGDRVDGFFRLFGDSDGDGHVDQSDRDLFRSAFKTSAGDAGSLWYFDFDGDGYVDGRDNGQFNRRFGQF
jgi:hypothetical protein